MENSEQPIRLVQDGETGDQFLVYDTSSGPQLDIRFESDTLWMTQAQIAQLFGRDQSVISRHIGNVLTDGELKEEGNMQKMHIANSDRPVAFYSLYQRTQAKLVFAVVSKTPSELVFERSDHRVANMGLTNWTSENIRKSDVAVSKNYLAEAEIRELNRLTTILLDIFEDQIDLGRLVVIADAERLLNRQLEQLGRAVLQHGGSMSASDARRKAETEYLRFAERRKLERHGKADAKIDELAREARNLLKKRRGSQ